MTWWVGCCQGWGTLLQVPGLPSTLSGRTDGQREYRVCVSVAIAVIRFSATVARRPNEYRAQLFSPVGNPVDESFLGQRAGPVDGLAVVLRTPRSRVDIDVIGVETESSGFNRIIDHPVEHSDTPDAGVVRDTDPTVLIEGDSSNFSGTPRTMLVVTVVLGHGVAVVVIDVGGRIGVVVLRQICGKFHQPNLKATSPKTRSFLIMSLINRSRFKNVRDNCYLDDLFGSRRQWWWRWRPCRCSLEARRPSRSCRTRQWRHRSGTTDIETADLDSNQFKLTNS